MSFSLVTSSTQQRSVNSLLNVLRSDKDPARQSLTIIIEFIVFLVINDMFDGKGRVLVRNLLRIIPVTKQDMLAIEYHLRFTLIDCREALTHSMNKKNKKKKMIRYAKIGGAALGAGALLAVTGGLAAPAIASGTVSLEIR